MGKNATTVQVAAAPDTMDQTGSTPTAGTEPAPAPARRAARGTGAGAKAATGRATRTSTARTPAGARNRAPAHTAVPSGSDWTVEELAEIRVDLVREIAERKADYERALAEITRLQQSDGDGAGDDQADAGSKTFEREQELSIANNRQNLLVQMERAMERLDKGTYGHCESCSLPIMKARLQAFPSATLCVKCKQREERR